MNRLFGNTGSEAFNQPIFIVGPGRAGSTLLRVMLNSHSELDISKESYFIPVLANEWRPGMSDQEIETFFSRLESYPRKPEQAIIDYLEWDHRELLELLKDLRDARYPEIVERIFTARTKRLGKRFWGNKTPDYCFHVPRLLELFPESKLIFLIRDGRDVTLSYQSCDWGPNNALECARYYQKLANHYKNARESFPDAAIMVTRYEDLTAEPRETLKRICDFIGVGYEPEMLEFNNNLSAHFASEEALKDHQKLKNPARADSVARWRKEMRRRNIVQFEAIAGDSLTLFNYDHHAPQSMEWLWFYGARIWNKTQSLKYQATEVSAWTIKKLFRRFGKNYSFKWHNTKRA